MFILILNLIWEFSHYRLYIDLTGIPSTIHLIGASFVDVFLALILFTVVSIKYKSIKWINDPKKQDYLLLLIFGLILAFFWEFVNLNLGRWAYIEQMPTIFSVGLSPLIQLALTGVLSLWVMRYLFSQKTI